MKLLSVIILFSQLCLGQGTLTSHSCLLAAKQENLDLEQWICNETNSDLPCVIKDRTSLNAKFGMKNGPAIPVPSSLSVCGLGSVGMDCRYTNVKYQNLRLEWEEWTVSQYMRTRTAHVTDGSLSQPCPYITEWEAYDCAAIYEKGERSSGVYTIYPAGGAGIRVFCHMDVYGGGWTIFQRRYNGHVDFYRDWEEYAEGFGDPAGEYWLGLRHIHTLTLGQQNILYVHVEDFEVGEKYAKYGIFDISSEAGKFRLTVDLYSGNAGDSLSDHNGQKFSTKDEDNDESPIHCSDDKKGGWWFKGCYAAFLNGPFSSTQVYNVEAANYWYTLRNEWYSVKSSSMMLRRGDFNP